MTGDPISLPPGHPGSFRVLNHQARAVPLLIATLLIAYLSGYLVLRGKAVPIGTTRGKDIYLLPRWDWMRESNIVYTLYRPLMSLDSVVSGKVLGWPGPSYYGRPITNPMDANFHLQLITDP